MGAVDLICLLIVGDAASPSPAQLPVAATNGLGAGSGSATISPARRPDRVPRTAHYRRCRPTATGTSHPRRRDRTGRPRRRGSCQIGERFIAATAVVTWIEIDESYFHE